MDGNETGFYVLSVKSGYSTATPTRTWSVGVSVSVWSGLVESEIVHGFLPSFSQTEKVKFIVHDEVVEEETFIVKGLSIEQGKF